MNRSVGSSIVASLLIGVTASQAIAQTPPAAAPPPAPPPADAWNTPHPSPPPGPQGAPPSYAPPPGYAQPPQYPPPAPYGGYGAPNPYGWGGQPGFNQQALFVYENEKKSPGIALLVNFLFPGLGSIYADHALGALLTWGLIIGGVAVAVVGINQDLENGRTEVNPAPIVAGYVMVLGGIVYSYVDAYASAKAFNRALAQRLGLPVGFTLAPAPIVVGTSVAWGPAIGFRF
jgi:hypothetical protein